MNAVRALLTGIVDYAGMYPPASVSLEEAVANYASYRRGPDAWMLGRLILPSEKLSAAAEAVARIRESGDPWPVSIVGELTAPPKADALRVESVEVRASDVESIARIGETTIPGTEVFVEVAPGRAMRDLLAAIKRAGIGAKLRTGGTTAEAFPPSRAIASFLRACTDLDVPFKVTAGLHHPVRGEFRLTYDDSAPRGWMFGYLNVFVAAALIAHGIGDEHGVEALEETDPHAFRFSEHGLSWRGIRLSSAALAATRGRARSFGSCSFREPVDELRSVTS